MSAIADADDGNFSCTVTCDANNNITEIEEVQTSGMNTATLITDSVRLSAGHSFIQSDATESQNQLPSTHVCPGPTAYDWGHASMLFPGVNPGEPCDVFQQGEACFELAGRPLSACVKWQHGSEPQRRTFTNPTSEGDQRNLYGQGKPMAKNSSGSGADWYLGTAAESLSAGLTVNSRTMFEGTVAPTDMDRATDAREKGRIGIFGTGNAYAGSSGRVTSERIGRDLNPLGRGDGSAYVGGAMNYGRIAPTLPKSSARPGWGNSVNNGCADCGLHQGGPGGGGLPGGGGGGSTIPPGCPYTWEDIDDWKDEMDNWRSGHYFSGGDFNCPCMQKTLFVCSLCSRSSWDNPSMVQTCINELCSCAKKGGIVANCRLEYKDKLGNFYQTNIPCFPKSGGKYGSGNTDCDDAIDQYLWYRDTDCAKEWKVQLDAVDPFKWCEAGPTEWGELKDECYIDCIAEHLGDLDDIADCQLCCVMQITEFRGGPIAACC